MINSSSSSSSSNSNNNNNSSRLMMWSIVDRGQPVILNSVRSTRKVHKLTIKLVVLWISKTNMVINKLIRNDSLY